MDFKKRELDGTYRYFGEKGHKVEGGTVASGNVLLGFDKVGDAGHQGRRKGFYKSAFKR